MKVAPAMLALGLVLATAACGRDPEGEGEGGGNNTAVPATVPEAMNESLMQDPQNHAVPLDAPTATPATLTAIPATFQGRWGMGAADCEPGRADAKGLMEVADNTLRFYESRGTAKNLRQLSAEKIGFDLPMSGEGMSWAEPTALTITSDGKTLVREVKGSPDRAGSFRYLKCPA